jgi:hypothetical protein
MSEPTPQGIPSPRLSEATKRSANFRIPPFDPLAAELDKIATAAWTPMSTVARLRGRARPAPNSPIRL